MLGAKLIALAAAIALATTPHVAGKAQTTHVRIHVRSHATHENEHATTAHHDSEWQPRQAFLYERDELLCPHGWNTVQVARVDGVYCVQGAATCDGATSGPCPDATEGLPYGSHCEQREDNGMYACVANAHGCEREQRPISVEGIEGVFCVEGFACVAHANGACPGPQEGLPWGASCGIVKTGVYGCQANAIDNDKEKEEEDSEESDEVKLCDGNDQSPISVEGVQGVFCVTGHPCVATRQGACPSPQAGLAYGAYCGPVKTGVLGCKPIQATEDSSSSSMEEDSSDETIVVDIDVCDGKDESPISVEGVKGFFCVPGQACVAKINGTCPGPQEGLAYGSSCRLIKTGVYGCQPNTETTEDSSEETIVVDIDVCDGKDETPISVEGVKGFFCVPGQACVAKINGQCPGPQEGLEYGAYCGTVKTGVFGCLPITDDDQESEESVTPKDDGEDSSSASGSVGDESSSASGSVEADSASGSVEAGSYSTSASGSVEVDSSSSDSASGSVGGERSSSSSSGTGSVEVDSSSASGSVGDESASASASGSVGGESSSSSASGSFSGSVGDESSSASSSGSVGDESSSASGSVGDESSSASGSVGGESSSSSASGSFSGSVGDESSSASSSGSVGDESSSASGSVGGESSSSSASASSSGSVGDESASASASSSGSAADESSSASASASGSLEADNTKKHHHHHHRHHLKHHKN